MSEGDYLWAALGLGVFAALGVCVLGLAVGVVLGWMLARWERRHGGWR